MNTTDQKIEILTGVVHQLLAKMEKMEANQLPRHQWLSSSEIAVAVGVTNRTIQNWMKEGKFPKETYCRKARGKYYIYKFDKTLAISVAERLKRGED